MPNGNAPVNSLANLPRADSNGLLCHAQPSNNIAWPPTGPALLVDSFEFMTTLYHYFYHYLEGIPWKDAERRL